MTETERVERGKKEQSEQERKSAVAGQDANLKNLLYARAPGCCPGAMR